MSNISRRDGYNSSRCAACTYQHRTCAPDCILAPYFPLHRQRQFLKANKLFGVSNIIKIIKNLDPPDKDMAVKTIELESTARANYPVGGCYRMIQDLQRRVEYDQAELELVLHQLAVCRAQAPQQQQEQEQQEQQQSHLQMQESRSCDSSLSCEMVNNPDILNS